MDTITNSRELFIIEIVINYLQSVYPNIYSDKEIIRRYIEYNKLNNKKNLSEINKDVKFPIPLKVKPSYRIINDVDTKTSPVDIVFDGDNDLFNSLNNRSDIIDI